MVENVPTQYSALFLGHEIATSEYTIQKDHVYQNDRGRALAAVKTHQFVA
jgi:hypothetical protein